MQPPPPPLLQPPGGAGVPGPLSPGWDSLELSPLPSTATSAQAPPQAEARAERPLAAPLPVSVVATRNGTGGSGGSEQLHTLESPSAQDGEALNGGGGVSVGVVHHHLHEHHSRGQHAAGAMGAGAPLRVDSSDELEGGYPSIADPMNLQFEDDGWGVQPRRGLWRERLRRLCCCACCCEGGGDPLLISTIVGVVVGIAAGCLLRMAHPSPTAIDLIGFPGELMLRLLKMLVLPLVAGSMVAGVCALRKSTGGVARLGRLALGYYAGTTLLAVLLGIGLVMAIRPGRGQPLADLGGGGGGSSMCGGVGEVAEQLPPDAPLGITEALMQVARNMFPDNVVSAAVDMNILGVIVFSLGFGAALSSLGEEAEPMIHAVGVFNGAISKMVGGVLWTSPVGVASLIAASICRACDIGRTLGALGLWITTVMAGLLIMAVLVLPAILWLVTKRNPLEVARGFAPALALAFGTSSTSAALPVTMDCARELGCDDGTVSFFLPLGTTVNMNGTALYEATTVLFIAQAHGVNLGIAQVVVVACTATLAAVGAAAIPSAGLVTMLMVLQAVGLDQYASDLAVILAVDWLLDRCRTAVNTLSDAFGTVVVDAACKAGGGGSGGGGQYSALELT